jgi:hypothetical protein
MDERPSSETPYGELGWELTENVLRVVADCVEHGPAAESLRTTAEFARRLAPHGNSLGLHATASAGRLVVLVAEGRPNPGRSSVLSIECTGGRIRIETRHPGRDPMSFDYAGTRGPEPVLEEMIRLAQMRSWRMPDVGPV